MKTLKIDTNSIKFKLWLWFMIFAAGVILTLWFLQVFFLNNHYSVMKRSATNKAVIAIVSAYRTTDSDREFINEVNDISTANDIFTYFETPDGKNAFPGINWDSKASLHKYHQEKVNARTRLVSSSRRNSFSFEDRNADSGNKTIVYAKRISVKDKAEIFMYAFSPLYPVTSTISILRTQLIYITAIVLALAFLLSFVLSTKITSPIINITKKVERLAKGKYGVTFQGGQYTEISDLADTLTNASLELDKADSMQKDLIANVSHDLRTPLTMIKSYAEMIQDISGEDPEKRNQHLQVIIDETDRLNVLVGDMLAISRFQSGATTMNRSIFNLKESVKTLVQSYELLEEQEGIHIYFVCNDKHLYVNADEERIKQVFSNLITNAIKFCGTDKSVIVTLKKKGNRVLCRVTDHGIGIPENELHNIWERYYKASSNNVREIKGSGLGLSIVKEILSLHHSNFGVESKMGHGTTFWFELSSRK